MPPVQVSTRNGSATLYSLEGGRVVRPAQFSIPLAREERRQGVGTRLFADVLAATKEHFPDARTLRVFSASEGVTAFWKRQGFKIANPNGPLDSTVLERPVSRLASAIRVARRYAARPPRRRLTVGELPDQEREKLPETTFASDLEFQVKKRPSHIQVNVLAGKAWIGGVVATSITREELESTGMLPTFEALERKVGKDLKLFAVGSASLWKALRGHRAGRKAYLILLNEAAKMGGAVGPEDSWRGSGYDGTSGDAQQVWKSILKLPGIQSEGHFHYGSGLQSEIDKGLKSRARGFPRRKKKYRRTDLPPEDER